MRTKLGLLGLCAIVVGIMSMSAGAAQGATLSWLILNSTHTTATNLLAELEGEKDSATLVLHGEVATLKILLTCTEFLLVGVNLDGSDGLEPGGRVVFHGCAVTDDKGVAYKCTVKTAGTAAGTIESGKGKGLLELVGGVVETKIEPESGPTGSFAAIRFEGAECTLPEINQVHGTLRLVDCEKFATTHKVKHLVEPDQTNSALYIGGHSAKQLEITKILGSVWIKLKGAHVGLEWSGMDV
jgi:hypothetical protein